MSNSRSVKRRSLKTAGTRSPGDLAGAAGPPRQSGWLLRIPPGVNLWTLFRQAGVLRPVVILVVMYLLQVLLSIATWFVIGAVFQGHFDLGWLIAWGILLSIIRCKS
jgi:hypothetical protein